MLPACQFVAGEASYHAAYTEWTSRFLTRLVSQTLTLPPLEQGIKGNRHMLMIEKTILVSACLSINACEKTFVNLQDALISGRGEPPVSERQLDQPFSI